jgi:methylmalonyl-CoA epimerase
MERNIRRVHHIGIAVESIDAALTFYQDGLGITPADVHPVDDQGVRAAFLPAGESAIELLEPLGETSRLRQFIEKRGEGIHHVCLEVEDLQAALDRLSEAGHRLIDTAPRQGPGGKIAFVHPKSAHGVLVELIETTR